MVNLSRCIRDTCTRGSLYRANGSRATEVRASDLLPSDLPPRDAQLEDSVAPPSAPQSFHNSDTNLQRGVGRLTLLVFGVIFSVALFCAYKILPFYYYYYSLQEQMVQLARVANIHTDKEIRDKLAAHLKRYEIPASIDDLLIERNGGTVRMELAYDEFFYIEYQGEVHDLHTFHFVAYAEEEIDD